MIETKELADVYAREFGMSREDVAEQERRKWSQKQQDKPCVSQDLSFKFFKTHR